MTPHYLTPTDAGIMVGILIMGFGLILAAAVKFFANKSREEHRLDAEAIEEVRFLEAIENERRLYLPAAVAEVELFLDPHYAARNAVERSDEDNLAFMEQQANDLYVRRRAQAAPTNKWNIDAWAAAQLYQSKSPPSRPVYCIWSRTNCPMSYACQLRHFW